MRKLLALILLTIITMSACKKEDKNTTMINATAYVGTEKAIANIAFIKASESHVIENEKTVKAYFDALPGNARNAKMYTSQFKDYFAPGDYIIVVQLVLPLKDAYTYRRITISHGNSSTENVMVFKSDGSYPYQPWNNKY